MTEEEPHKRALSQGFKAGLVRAFRLPIVIKSVRDVHMGGHKWLEFGTLKGEPAAPSNDARVPT